VKNQIKSTEAVYDHFEHLKDEPNEYMHLLFTDENNCYHSDVCIASGLMDRVGIDRIVALKAMLNAEGSVRVYMIHNHPQMPAVPSEDDNQSTEMMMGIAKLAGLSFIEHLIIGGRNDFYSFREQKRTVFE